MTILEEIASLAKQADDAINARTNAAMAAIVDAESALQNANIRFVVSVDSTVGRVCFTRIGKEFRIGLNDGPDACKPWQECNRHQKIGMAAAIPDMLDAVRDALLNQLKEHENQ